MAKPLLAARPSSTQANWVSEPAVAASWLIFGEAPVERSASV
ncbi:hypothetical protein [Massilia eburnea]